MKRQVTITTFLKWQSNYEREYQAISWLRYDVDKSDRRLVDTLWCEACRKNEDKIMSMKNYSDHWIKGSKNHKTSNVVDHANTDQHKAAMIHVKKASNQPITTYSPIARSLLNLDETTLKRMEICYVIAKESMAFKKYPALYALGLRHDVDLGQAYKTKDSAKLFTHYIAESQRQNFISSLSASSRFFSFLMDGSTDAGNVEDELVVIMHSVHDAASETIKSCARFFSIEVPNRADSDGLLECLGESLKMLGITNLDKANVLGTKPILIGGGTDGASVNISNQNGMKGKIQKELPWIFWAWCFAHRLELACKDSLSSGLFADIAEMLLRLYYLYQKSPKKSKELADIVSNLKEVFEFPKGGGNIPVRSQGSRWINHKRKTLQRYVDRYGAYMTHLMTLIEDKSIKSGDRARLKGYLQKWKQPRMLVGAAMYIDLLKSPSVLSLSLQEDGLDVVTGVKNILKSSKSLKQMSDEDPLEWPTVKLVKTRIKEESDGFVYQGASLQGYSSRILQECAKHALADLRRLDEEMRSRLEWSDVQMLRSILVFLDTQSWCKRADSEDDDLDEINAAVEYITSHFREPLEAAGTTLSSIRDEIEEVVDYARKYLNIGTESYQNIWYKLHVAPDVAKWPNVLVLCELLFSLPFSNGTVERIFSSMKVIKTDRRTRLHTETLCDLMEIQVQGPPLSDFHQGMLYSYGGRVVAQLGELTRCHEGHTRQGKVQRLPALCRQPRRSLSQRCHWTTGTIGFNPATRTQIQFWRVRFGLIPVLVYILLLMLI